MRRKNKKDEIAKDQSVEELARKVLRDWGWTPEQIEAWGNDTEALIELITCD